MRRKILINEKEKQNINNFLAQKDKFIVEGDDDKVYDFSKGDSPDLIRGKKDFQFSTVEGLDNKDNIKTIATSGKGNVSVNPAKHAIVAECMRNSEYRMIKRYVEDTFLGYYTESSNNALVKEGPIVDMLESNLVENHHHIEILREGENIEYYTNGTYSPHKLDDDNFKISKVPFDKLKETVSSKVLNGTYSMIYPSAKKYSLYEICLMLMNTTTICGKMIEKNKFGVFKMVNGSSKPKEADLTPVLSYHLDNKKEYMMFYGINGPKDDINGRYYAIFSDTEAYRYSLILSEYAASVLPHLDIHYPAYYVLPIKSDDIPSDYEELVVGEDQPITGIPIFENLLRKVIA